MATPATVPMLAPDGSTGEIPADKVAAASAAGFKKAYQMQSPDGQTGYIPEERLPDAQKAGFKLTGPGPATPAPPDTRNAVQKAFDTFTSEQPAGGPGAFAPGGPGALKLLQGAADTLSPLVHPIKTAQAAYEGLVHPSMGQMVAGPAYPMAKGLVQGAIHDPVRTAGSLVAGTAEGEAGGALLGGAGDASTALVNTAKSAAGKLVPSLVDGPPESLMTRAIKPGKNNVNWNTDVQKALPLIKSAEDQLGHPIQGVDDALAATGLAKKSIWQQYQARLGPAAQQGAVIDGNQIADAMMNSIDKRTALQNPGLLDKVKAVADTYRHPMPLADAEDFLQSANKDLTSYYAKNKVGQQVAENDPEISSTVAEAGALRTALYSKLDQVSGPGAAQLKQAYGSLTNVEKELTGRQLVAARQNPESLSEQISTVRGAAQIAKGVATFDPGSIVEGAQNIGVSRALKARNSSDSMIERAMSKTQPAQPFPMPSTPQIAGLLQRGPIAAGAPESAGGPSAPPPPFNYTNRAQRLGLLLPQRAGGPFELPYVPQMGGDEQLAALMHYLRNNKPPPALPAKASPIQLPPPE